jgi:hypothetical protein
MSGFIVVTILVNPTATLAGSRSLATTKSFTGSSFGLTASGATGTKTFGLTPTISGITIDSTTGVITAASTLDTGTYLESVTVVDSLGVLANFAFTVIINALPTISGDSNITTTVGTAKSSAAFTSTLGTGTKTYSLISAHSNTTINSVTGIVTVSALATTDSFTQTVQVTDSAGATAQTTMTISINGAIVIGGGSGITTTFGRADSSTAFTATGGTGALTFGITPTIDGITIGNDGKIQVSSSTAAGTFNESVTVTDQVGAVSYASITLIVNAEITFSGGSLGAQIAVTPIPLDGYATWTAPATGTYRITAVGAAGASRSSNGNGTGISGGNGASMSGEFFFTEGTVLRYLVGTNGSRYFAGGNGGGGTFVALADYTPLIVAGGGGGGGVATSGEAASYIASNLPSYGGSNGGTSQSGCNPNGMGGAGFSSDAIDNGSNPARSFTHGGSGGGVAPNACQGNGISNGGNGGGGASSRGGGGGGGWTGGKGGDGGTTLTSGKGGLGGTSYNIGANQYNTFYPSIINNGLLTIAPIKAFSFGFTTTAGIQKTSPAFVAAGGTGSKSYALSPNISGITANPITGELTIDTSVVAGAYSLTLIATDSLGVTGTRAISVLVDSAMAVSGDTTVATTFGTTKANSSFAVSNGTGTKNWSLQTPLTGVSVSSDSGIVTVAPTLAVGTYYDTLVVTDSVGATAYWPITIVVNTALTIAVGNITTTAGRADSTTATSTGGTGAKSYSLSPTLTGITIDSVTGVVSVATNTPYSATFYTETVTVTDASGALAKKTIKITVNQGLTLGGGGNIATTLSRPNTSVAYSYAGGTGSKTLTISPIISGITIDSTTGIVSVDGTLSVGSYLETVTVTDALGVSVSKLETITVNDTILIAGGSPITTTYLTAKNSTAFTATRGTSTKTWSLVTPPAGISVDTASGIVKTDTNLAVGTYTVTLRATDIVGATADTSVVITVNGSIVISGGDTSIVTTNGRSTSSRAFSATNGTGTLTFSILPVVSGLSITQGGVVLVDSATAAATYNESVTVTDSAGSVAKVAIQILVNPAILVSLGSGGGSSGLGRPTGVNPIVSYTTATMSGTTFVDAFGHSNSTANSGVTIANGIATFDGTGGNQPTTMANNLASFYSGNTYPLSTSIFARIYPTGDGVILAELGSQGNKAGWFDSQIEMVSGVLKFRVWEGNGVGIITSSIATPLNNWYYVGFVYDQQAGKLTAYVNGQVAAIISESRLAPSALYYTLGADENSAFGSQIGAGAAGHFKLSQLDIFNAALSGSQVLAMSGGGASSAILTTVGIAQSSSAITSTGGTGGNTLSMSPSNISGITFDPSTGIITADSTTAVGTYFETITATDSFGVTGSSVYTVTIDSAVVVAAGSDVITTQSIARKSDTFTATLGTGTKTFSLTPVISGISIDTNTGVLSVANTVLAGTYYETVVATDSVGAIGVKATTILVNNPLTIGGGSNETTTAGRADSSTAFTHAGGTTPWKFTISPTVAGITVDSVTGIVYIAATTAAGTYLETITVTDSVFASASTLMTIIVNPAITVTGSTPSLAINTTNTIAQSSTAIRGNYGTGALALSMSPTTNQGISFNSSTGIITSDSTTLAGTYLETITATDSFGVTGSTTFTIVVNPAIVFTAGGNIITSQGIAGKSDTYSATLGTGVKKFSLTDTITGLTIDSNTGVITAANSILAGTYYDTVIATDSVGATAYRAMSLLVNPPVVIGGGSNIITTFGRADSSTAFTHTGGTTPWVFTIAPAVTGITIDSVTGVVKVAATTIAGTYLETVTVTDSVSASAAVTMSVKVNPGIVITGGPAMQTGSIYFGNALTNGMTVAPGAFPSTVNDFTISFWQYLNTSSFSSSPRVFSFGTWDTSPLALSEESGSGYCPNFCFWMGGLHAQNNASKSITTTAGFQTVLFQKWAHIEIDRSGNNIYIFINGQLFSTGTFSGSLNLSTAGFVLGNETANDASFPGYLTNFQMKTVASHTSSFTLPTAASIPDGSTILQVQAQNGSTFTQDSSGTGKSFTNNGSTYSALSPFNTTGYLINTTQTIPQSSVAVSGLGGTDTLTLAMSPTISEISFDPTTGIVSVTGNKPAGTYYETITATDRLGVTGSTMYTILVNPIVGIRGGSAIATTSGTPLSSTAFIADSGTGTKTWSIVSAPTSSGITINSSTGVITSDSSVVVGTYLITVRASDTVGYYTETTTSVRVNQLVAIAGGQDSITVTHGFARQTAPFTATLGTGTLKFSITPAVPGISIDTYTGIVTIDSITASGNNLSAIYSETVVATDSVSSTTKVALKVTVNPAITVTGINGTLNGTLMPQTGLVGYWGFDSAATLGTNSLTGSSLTINSGASWTTSGKYGGGLALNGTSGSLSGTVANLPVGNSGYTLSAWVNSTTISGAHGILGWGVWGSGNGTNAFRLANNGLDNYWWGNDLLTPQFTGSNSLLNLWHRVTASWDGYTRKIYLDGALISSDHPGTLSSTAVNFNIGTTNTGEWFAGTLDDVAIYNRALTDTEVATFGTGYGTTNPVAIATTVTIPGHSTAAQGNYGTGALVLSTTGPNPTAAGITFDPSTGIISADSSVAVGTYFETITATDTLGAFGSSLYTIVVNPALVVIKGSNISTTYGTALSSAAFSANYGTGGRRYSISPTISGITIDSITGIVTADSTTGRADSTTIYSETITVTDDVGAIGTTLMTVTINQVVAIFGGVDSITTTRGLAAYTPAFTATFGTNNKVWTIAPTVAGITINPTTGVVTIDSSTASGSGFTPGVYYETVTATDSVTSSTSVALKITVNHEIVVSGGSDIYTTYTIPLTSAAFSSAYGTGSRSFTLSPIIAGITIDSVTGIVSVDSSVVAGTYRESVTAIDSLGAIGTKAETITVNAALAIVNARPIVTTYGIAQSSGAYIANNGTGFRSYALFPPITGITIDSITGIVTAAVGAGSATDTMTYIETVTATDTVGATGTLAITIIINHPIVISGGQSYLVTTRGRSDSTTAFIATYGTSTKRWSITPGESGISIDSNTGIVSVSATTAANTLYTETITATDSVGAIARVTMTIRVNPEISVSGGSDITTTTGVGMSSAAFVGANGSTAATGGSGVFAYSLTPYIQYISIDTNSGVVTVDTALAAGTYSETVVATDPLGQKGYKAVMVYVNQAITISGGSGITTTTGIARSSLAFTSANGTGTRTFSITGGAHGVSITQTGIVTVDSSTSSGTYIETITVSDTVSAFATKSITILVNVPVLIGGGSNVLTTLGRADSSSAFTVTGGTSTYTFSISPSTNSGITINATSGVISVTAATAVGTYLETVTVTDSVTASSSKTMTVQVNPSVTISGGSGITTTQGIGRSSTAFIASGGTTAATNGSGVFAYSILNPFTYITIDTVSGIVTVDTALAAGTYVETIVATDSLGMKGYLAMTILVNPVITVTAGSNITTTTGYSRSSTAFASANGTGSRVFSITGASDGITISSGGVVTVDSSTSPGTYIETITATDDRGAVGIKLITIIVNNSIAITGGGNILTTFARAESSTAFTETGGTAAFTYSIAPYVAGITINATTGVVTASAATVAGTYVETVTVTDSVTANSSTTMTIIVNQAVSVTGGSDINTTYGIALSSTAFVAGGGTTAATSGTGTFTYSITPNTNTHITIDPASGVVSVDSSLAANTYYETVVATDSLGMKGYKSFTIVIAASIQVSGGSAITTTNGVLRRSTAFVASNGTGVKNFTLTPAVAGITIDSITGVITVDSATAIGTYDETVIATDQVGAQGTSTSHIIVNTPVAIGGGSNVTSTFGQTVYSTAFTKNYGTGPWVFSLSPTLTGITIDSATGIVKVGPTAARGTVIETVTITDAVGSVASTQMTIYVNDTITISAGSNIVTSSTRLLSSTAFVATGGTTIATNGTGTFKWSIQAMTVDTGTGLGAKTVANIGASGISIDTSSGIVTAQVTYNGYKLANGTYTSTGETFSVTIAVSDTTGAVTTQVMTVRVNINVAFAPINKSLSRCDFCTTSGHARNLKALSGLYGVAPYSFAISPAITGITLNSSTGVITIDTNTPIPTSPGYYLETLTVTDSVGSTFSTTVNIYINTAIQAPNVTAGLATTSGIRLTGDTMTAGGGTGAVAFTTSPDYSAQGIFLIQDVDSDGLPLPPHYVISETATVGTYYETITVKDILNFTDVTVIKIVVNPVVVVTGGANVTTTYGIRQVTPAFVSDTSTGTGVKTFGISPTRTGITIDTNSGVVTVESNTAVGTWIETITATDQVGATGYKTMTIIVNTGVSLAGGSNITTTQGFARSSAAFVATYGTGTKVYSISPTVAGITVDSVTGIVTADSTTMAGTYYETVTATDSVSATATKALTVLVNGPLKIGGGASSWITTYGRADTITAFTYGGGTTPWRFGITPTVSGITIDTVTGVIRLSATVVSGTYLETVSVTDSISAIASTTILITVNDSITVLNGGNVNTTHGIAMYSAPFNATGGTVLGKGGVRALSFSLQTTYAGITIDTDSGIVYVDSSTPAGTYYDTVVATDSLTVTGTKAITIVVAQVVTVTNGSNIYTTVGHALSSAQFISANGTGTRVFSIAPYVSGITINQSGVVTADSTTAIGTYIETVTATDSVTAFGIETMTIVINTPVVIAGGQSILYDTFGLKETTTAFTVSGGTPSYRYSITPIVDGITIDSITGIVTVETRTIANTYLMTVKVTDSVTAFDTKSLTILVNPAINFGSTGSNIVTTQGRTKASIAFTATGGTIGGVGGTGPLVYTIAGSPANAGITIDSVTGIVSVSSAVTAFSSSVKQIYYETITGTDSLGVKGYAYETITVNPNVSIRGGSNITTTQGIARSSATFFVDSGTIISTGGSSNYSFALTGDATSYFHIDTTTLAAFTLRVDSTLAFGTYRETITVTDSAGDTKTTAVTVLINDIIRLTQLSNIYTTRGRTDSSTTISATGGTTPITYGWAINPTDTGITLDTSTGKVSVGKLVAAGIYNLTIIATDTVGATASETISVRVNPAITVSGGSNLVTTQGIATASNAFVGAGGTIANSGGTGALVYSIVSTPVSGAISINSSSGVVSVSSAITSNNSTTTQIYRETITVTDSLGETGTITETITVNPLPSAINGSNITTTAGVGRSSSVFTSVYGTVVGRGGSANYTYSITGPTGDQAKFTVYAIDTNTFQVRVDTNTIAGTYPETVTITDSVGATGQVALMVYVNSAIALSETVSVVYTTFGKALTWNSTTASGGTSPITYAITGRQLTGSHDTITATTASIYFDSTTPVGTWIETITATDSVGATAIETMTLVVNPVVRIDSGTPTITTTQGIGVRSAAYLGSGGTWSGTGGTGNLQFTLTSNPAGAPITLDTSTANRAYVVVDSSIVSTNSTTAKIYYETITITDSLGMVAYAYETITVNPVIAFAGGSNITTTQGVGRYSTLYTVSQGTISGTSPYRYAINGSASYFRVDTTTSSTFRVWTDTTTVAGTYFETVTVTDSVGATLAIGLVVQVNLPIVLTETTSAIYTTFGKAIMWNSTTSSGGTSPITYAITGRTLAAGHDTITATTGAIYFDSTTPVGLWIETITATDSVGATAIETMSIKVNPAITITGGSNIVTTSGIAFTSDTVTASGGTTALSGGTGSIVLTLTGTANSSYISFNATTGRITALSTLPVGVYYETITGTDSINTTGALYETITVNNLPTITGSATINQTFDTGTSTTYTFAQGTGPLNSVVSGQFATGIAWDTSTAGSAKLTINQFMPLQTLYETITVTDSVGAVVTLPLTVNFLRGNRSVTETATSTSIRYGDTTTVSAIGYPNGIACTPKIYNVGGYTYVEFDSATGCAYAVPAGVTTLEALVVGGGGGASFGSNAGGGGAGTVLQTISPISVTPNSIIYETVGAGGTSGWLSQSNWGASGSGVNSTITLGGNAYIANGGGAGGGNGVLAGGSGGSGGGGGYNGSTHALGGSFANSNYAGWYESGTAGNQASNYRGGAGGGASTPYGTDTHNGGYGVTVWGYGVGGGGGGWSSGLGDTSTGGGNARSADSNYPCYGTWPGTSTQLCDGKPNTGGGAGGGGAGGSGIIVLRFPTPAAYTAPLVDGNLTYSTSSTICTVDTTTGLVTATGGTGTCAIVASVPQGTYYNAETTTINIAIRAADTVTVSAKPVAPVFYTGSAASFVTSETITGLQFADTKSVVVYNFASVAPTNCATGGTCNVGDTGPGGGVVFYDAGSTQAWGRYLEVAPSTWSGTDASSAGAWCSNTSASVGYTSTSLGDGLLDTTIMGGGCTTGAGTKAITYSGGSRIDWYLPSSAEMSQLYSSRATAGINLAGTGNAYWTSTETSAANAIALSMTDGSLSATAKSNSSVLVRPIRAFDVVSNSYSSSTTSPTNAGTYLATPSALSLSAGRLTSNYAGFKYDTTLVTVRKISQSTLALLQNLVAVSSVNLSLSTVGGSGSGSISYKVIPGGTATACTVTGNLLTATSGGTCLVAALKSADNNFYAMAAKTTAVTFESFTSFIPAGNISYTGSTIQLPGQVQFTVLAIPTFSITSFTPTSTVAGGTVVITGVAFDSVTAVFIGGTRNAVTSFNIDSSTQITAKIAASNLSGTIRLRNSLFEITVSSGIFTLATAPIFTLSNTSDSVTAGDAIVGFTPINSGGVPTSYAITGGSLPAGLTFNTSTGQLSGAPTTTLAQTTFTITATNGQGSATQNYTLTVN